jgi:hypothetical protein
LGSTAGGWLAGTVGVKVGRGVRVGNGVASGAGPAQPASSASIKSALKNIRVRVVGLVFIVLIPCSKHPQLASKHRVNGLHTNTRV